MSLKIVVLAKQVPDTRNVGKDAMKEDGTINRAALPAIFNPEDLNALEQALQLKEQNPGSTITLLTMGPPRAAEIIQEGLFRGADGGIVLTDRAFAGADTLATSYALSCAVRKIKDYDIILGGRQAIDGDTAQVGPQIAEKLGIPQVTYAEQILNIENGKATVKRRLERGVETVVVPLPAVITVNGSADALTDDGNDGHTGSYRLMGIKKTFLHISVKRSIQTGVCQLVFSMVIFGGNLSQSVHGLIVSIRCCHIFLIKCHHPFRLRFHTLIFCFCRIQLNLIVCRI